MVMFDTEKDMVSMILLWPDKLKTWEKLNERDV